MYLQIRKLQYKISKSKKKYKTQYAYISMLLMSSMNKIIKNRLLKKKN